MELHSVNAGSPKTVIWHDCEVRVSEMVRFYMAKNHCPAHIPSVRAAMRTVVLPSKGKALFAKRLKNMDHAGDAR